MVESQPSKIARMKWAHIESKLNRAKKQFLKSDLELLEVFHDQPETSANTGKIRQAILRTSNLARA